MAYFFFFTTPKETLSCDTDFYSYLLTGCELLCWIFYAFDDVNEIRKYSSAPAEVAASFQSKSESLLSFGHICDEYFSQYFGISWIKQ